MSGATAAGQPVPPLTATGVGEVAAPTEGKNLPSPLRRYRWLALAAMLLAFIVVGLGAYVRLSDAGLGCPDWPGCYGHWVGIPDRPHEQAAAAQAFPGKPVEAPKAWKEMVHRYFAGALGLLILALTIHAWRRRRLIGQSPALPTALLGLVIFQAALGMWTVTLLLKPVIVTAHLLGGMATLAMLVWMNLRLLGFDAPGASAASQRSVSGKGLRTAARIGLAVVVVQIALGGWVSSNYAALACTDFPTCQGLWFPPMDFDHAFHLIRDLGETATGELLPMTALTAIHWSHRVGALVVLIVVGGLAASLMRRREWWRWGALLAALLALQIGLGIANVLLSLPLPLAVAHNLGAALLLAGTLGLNLALNVRSRARKGASFNSGHRKILLPSQGFE